MEYKITCIKELPSALECWEYNNKDSETVTIPKGTVCDVGYWCKELTILYKGKAVCDVNSEMAKEYFSEIM